MKAKRNIVITFDGGALYMEEEWLEINDRKTLCIVMFKKGEKVYIDKSTLTEISN